MRAKDYVRALLPAFVAGTTILHAADYSYPMKIEPALSANFGELRPNHFHSGLDFRTQKREGIPVYAVADGYVSRIGILSWGYGNALYITHRNGTTSVYAHLREFVPPIALWAKKQQYAKQSFVIDEQLPPSLFRVKKGELIAYSGNSGHSMGPHLHFELRDAAQQPFNLLSRTIFSVPDKIPPQASHVYVYHLDYAENTFVRLLNYSFALRPTAAAYRIAGGDTIEVGNDVVFGVDMGDRKNGTQSAFGVYSVQLLYDDALVLEWTLDHFSFAETRFVNGIIDHDIYNDSRRYVSLLYRAPANKLTIFKHSADGGGTLVQAIGNKTKVEIRMMDDASNISKIVFWAKNNGSTNDRTIPTYSKMLYYQKSNSVTFQNFKMIVPYGALYESATMTMEYDNDFSGAITPLYSVKCSPSTPPHYNVIVGIRADIPPQHRSKVVMVGANGRGKKAVREGDFWLSSTREWGSFAINVDTEPPQIKYLYPRTDKIKKPHLVRFRVTDSMSGVKRCNGYVDGEWALFEPNGTTITYRIDYDRVKRGVWHKVRIAAEDDVGNVAEETHSIFF